MQLKSIASKLALFLLVGLASVALAAPVQFTPAQQESINKIGAKGGLVMQLANDSDALVVNLSLGGKQITDAELAEVKAFPKVAQLNLANTAITDAGLANVAGLAELTHLHLEKTGATDAGLAHLKNLAKLQYLNLYGTAVTDAGLANLSGLKELKRVYLWQTKVTDGGVANLKKGTPNLYVNRGEELAIVAAPPPAEAKPAEVKPASASAKPINTVCPVSGKPVDPTKTLVHEGKTIGFCCDMCPKAFQKEPAKFLVNLKADVKPEEAKPAEKKPEEKKPEEKKVAAAPAANATPAAATQAPAPAPAANLFGKTANSTCPISGKAVDPEFIVAYDGKAVGFCCPSCKEKFSGNPAAFVGKIKYDAAPAAPAAAPDKKAEIKPEPAKPQAAATPVNAKCPISGEDVKPTFTSVLDGKTVAFCCDKCLAKFAKEPAKYADKIAAAK
jgi:YHS domain-containing protein